MCQIPALVYLDDIIIVERTFGEHLNNIRKVSQRLQKANLKLNPKKCRFFQNKVSYLGHIISADGVKTYPEKTKAVVDWPRPETVPDLRSFLGLCTYYRRFVRNFSAVARPLHKLTEARLNFNWTKECEKSFNSLEQALITTPVSTYLRIDKEFILDTVASNEGMGAVLSQKIENEECAIAYFSKSLEKKLNSEDRPSWQEIAPESPATKPYWALWGLLNLKDGVLYRKWESDDGSSCRWQLILPKSKIQEVLREIHDSASGGHFGVMKTLSKTRERFYGIDFAPTSKNDAHLRSPKRMQNKN
ncbi:Retrovirus-related Pol polyprotein from transposon 297 [Araneus ventricosus]|uniref:RNA-directed DNA polymerase n=1 Tax=Araneus ventricosus TaxID=182803 RepID=A0A4Y2I1Z8_ARAVE|nr:Retrovirus-related Pol polyprotein from transposon 297 [Araneus ventricosus]